MLVASSAARSVWWVVALILAFMPIGVAWAFGIWPPAATVQEAFSLAYTHRALLNEGFHFVYTGHAALVALAFPASFLTEWLLPQQNDFVKQEAFAYIYFGLHGALLMLSFVAIGRWSSTSAARWLLLLVPFSIAFLEPVTFLGLYINYHRLEQLLFLWLAWAAIEWVQRSERSSSPLFIAGLGCLVGLAFTTKFSLAMVFLPYALVTTVRMSGTTVFEPRRTAVLAGSGLATVAIAYAAYLSFRGSYVIALMASVRDLYTPTLLTQRTPFLAAELTRWFDPAGYYFALQLLALAWLLLTVVIVWKTIRLRERWLVALVLADTIAATSLLMQFFPRQAMGTMLDITGFLACSLAVKAIALARVGTQKWPPAAVVAVSCCYLIAMMVGQPWHELNRLGANSEIARQLDLRLRARPDLPIVFYLDGLPQPLLFPSADLLIVQGASSSPISSRFLERHHPRLRFASSAGKRAPFPHVAVIPEYLATLPVTPAMREEWPGMYQRMSVLDENRALQRAFADIESDVYQFAEIRLRGGLLYFSSYPTRVTVYVAAS